METSSLLENHHVDNNREELLHSCEVMRVEVIGGWEIEMYSYENQINSLISK